MPDGKSLGYTHFQKGGMEGKIFLAKADGSGEEAITTNEGIALAGPNAVSPDGKKLLYTLLDPEHMKAALRLWVFADKSESAVMDLETGEFSIEKLPCPAWAPDGKSFLIPMKTDKGLALFDRIALVLSGGGALGAYQAGAYAALETRGVRPNWIAGQRDDRGAAEDADRNQVSFVEAGRQQREGRIGDGRQRPEPPRTRRSPEPRVRRSRASGS